MLELRRKTAVATLKVFAICGAEAALYLPARDVLSHAFVINACKAPDWVFDHFLIDTEFAGSPKTDEIALMFGALSYSNAITALRRFGRTHVGVTALTDCSMN